MEPYNSDNFLKYENKLHSYKEKIMGHDILSEEKINDLGCLENELLKYSSDKVRETSLLETITEIKIRNHVLRKANEIKEIETEIDKLRTIYLDHEVFEKLNPNKQKTIEERLQYLLFSDIDITYMG